MARSVWSPKLNQAFARMRPGQPARALAGAQPLPLPFPSPVDWRDVWIYQIVLDRFNNSHTPPSTPWDRISGSFQGGTFEGVRARLDYLRTLGAGAIWLSPVLKNCQYWTDTYHGYGIQDFVEIDPRYASDPARARQDPALAEDELRALVDDAHAHGIYVIFDIVLNHVGDVFAYPGSSPEGHSDAPWRDDPYPIRWRDGDGRARPDWPDLPAGADLSPDSLVWPEEFQRNAFFRRQGMGDERGGDFAVLKQMLTDLQEWSPADGRHYPVRNALIRAYQYLIARYDVDGYRIDTLKYVSPDFALTFGNAMREYAASIGKQNFFTFGEVYDDEEKIARFIGRNASSQSDLVGVDAALDFPLFFRLPSVAKGLSAPAEVAAMFQHRVQVERGVLTSHGEAGRYFVTFLDNHDQHARFYYADPADPHRYDDQLTLGLGCLFGLQGIPCLYYGTEQGLHGTVELANWDYRRGDPPLEAVREALWGKDWPGAFDEAHPFYQAVRRLSALRREQPALKFGRQYFRPISGDGAHFGVSPFSPGVLAFSRILADQEILVVANADTQTGWAGQVLVDFALNPPGTPYQLLFSNCERSLAAPDAGAPGPSAPGPVLELSAAGGVTIHEVDGSTTAGPARAVPVRLAPMEVQFLSRLRAESERGG